MTRPERTDDVKDTDETRRTIREEIAREREERQEREPLPLERIAKGYRDNQEARERQEEDENS